MSASIVTLNVGGILYTTTEATLLNYPESVLGSLVSHRLRGTKDPDGHLFIDRDGHTFRHVLNFLRSSQLCLPSNFKDLDLLSAEADFYQISPLIDAVKKYPKNVGKKGKTFYLEIIEVKIGGKFSESQAKTKLCGRNDILLTLPPSVIGTDFTEHRVCRMLQEYSKLTLNDSLDRLQAGDELLNLGWTLISSDLSTSSCFESPPTKTSGHQVIIEYTFRDRWSRYFEPDEPIQINPNHSKLLEAANV